MNIGSKLMVLYSMARALNKWFGSPASKSTGRRTPVIPGHRGRREPRHRIKVANGKWNMRAHRNNRKERKKR